MQYYRSETAAFKNSEKDYNRFYGLVLMITVLSPKGTGRYNSQL